MTGIEQLAALALAASADMPAPLDLEYIRDVLGRLVEDEADPSAAVIALVAASKPEARRIISELAAGRGPRLADAERQ